MKGLFENEGLEMKCLINVMGTWEASQRKTYQALYLSSSTLLNFKWTIYLNLNKKIIENLKIIRKHFNLGLEKVFLLKKQFLNFFTVFQCKGKGGRKRERETSIGGLRPSAGAPVGTEHRACNPSLRPDQESNQQPFDLQSGAQPRSHASKGSMVFLTMTENSVTISENIDLKNYEKLKISFLHRKSTISKSNKQAGKIFIMHILDKLIIQCIVYQYVYLYL